MLREIILLFFIVFAGTGGEICLSRAMKQIGEVHDFRPMSILRVMGRAMTVGWMWLALLLMASGFFALLGMLSLENVSFVIPVSALSYVVGAYGGSLILGEKVTAQRWLGVLLVCLGVTLVWKGKG
jgi:drug/metabolite transporter (DMT)-like permease